MKNTALQRSGRILLPVLLGIGAVALLALPLPGDPSGAEAREPLIAGSVCEAHELRAAQALDPELEIVIPPEFDLEFPSAAACLSHELAWDEDAPGPNQPIPFSHAHHAGLYQIDCNYCHGGTERSQAAAVPSVELCMGCHEQFPASYDELEGIRILKQYWEQQEPIPWVQIHRVPEHVQFRHNRHVAAGVDCTRCHGNVAEMDKLYLTPDTVWWQYGLPAQKLEMGWCIQCHRENEVSQDCYTCHY
jgi:hypothetical protein